MTAILLFTMLAETNDLTKSRTDSSSISRLQTTTNESDSEPRSHSTIQADFNKDFPIDNPEPADARSVSAFLFANIHELDHDIVVATDLMAAVVPPTVNVRLGDSVFASVCLGCADPDLPAAGDPSSFIAEQ